MKCLSFLIFILFLGSCSANRDSVVVLSSGEKLRLSYDETLFTVLRSEPPTMDWIRSSDTSSSWVQEHIMNGLVKFNLQDPHLKIEPALATSWQAQEKGRVWIFNLRKGVLWSDGVEFKAQHVLDGWKRLLDPNVAAPAADNLYPVVNARNFNQQKIKDFSLVGAKALDDYTIRVELEEPMGFFPLLMTHHTAFPVREDIIRKFGDMWTEPQNIVTLGPYKMIYWHHDSQLVLTRNETYWGEKPNIKNIVFYMIGKASTALRMFDRGRVDFMKDLPSAEIPRLSKRNEFHTLPGLRLYYYGFKLKKPPFDNPLVRKAIAHAINRDEIVKVLGGGQFPLKSWVPPGMFGFEEGIGLSFDIQKSKDLLKQAGYSDSKKIPTIILGFNTEEKHQRVAENIQAQLKTNLGINIELKNEEWKTYLSGLRSDSAYSIFRLGWVADYADPHNFLSIMTGHSPNNRTGWKNQEFDKIVRAGISELDEKKRLELYRKAQRILVEQDVPAIPLLADVNQVLVSSRIENYKDNPLDLYLFQYMRLKK